VEGFEGRKVQIFGVGFQEMGWGSIDSSALLLLARNRNKCEAFVKVETNLRVP